MIRIALAKGRLSEQAKERFQAIGLGEVINLKSRKLVFTDEENKIEYMLLKPSDVVTYVENGIADLGVVGSDVIMEKDQDVYELFDLGFGKCKFSIAAMKGSEDLMNRSELRVATKYPLVARKYFGERNKTNSLIPLGGSVELAPVVGLADCIVDIVETGSTLRANNLEILEDMFSVSARLICNKVSFRFLKTEMVDIVKKLKEASCS
jgi:ATP phosphoribosyltransferase